MGEAKETIKGSGQKTQRRPEDTGNLIDRVGSLMEAVSNCIVVKDNDTQTEGETAKADNLRKATLLRSCYTLLKGAKTLMENY